jgi:CheY-like chemotaxis protein
MKFLLIDDHALIREALCSVLRELRSDAVVLEAASCQQGTDLMREHADVSLILLDLRLPDRDGFDMLAVLRETYPAVGVVRFRPSTIATTWSKPWTKARLLHLEDLLARRASGRAAACPRRRRVYPARDPRSSSPHRWAPRRRQGHRIPDHPRRQPTWASRNGRWTCSR